VPLAQVASGRTWRPPGEAGGAARAEGKGTHDATPRHGLPVAVVIRRMGFAAFFASPARFKLKPGEGDFTQRKRKGRKAGRRRQEGECPCARQQWQWLFLAARRGSGGRTGRDSASCSLWIFERGPVSTVARASFGSLAPVPLPLPVQGRRNMHRRNGGTRRRRGTT
jgi:hypothetical protein